ncbi:MAG: c-type cytochrome, partial [bacterium]
MKWYCERRTSKNIAGTKILLSVLSIVLLVISFGFAGNPESTLDLYQMSNPYLRPKNGPPLTNVVHKVNLPWLYTWLKNPQGHDPTAKMPNLKLEEPEIQAIINYLKSIADSTFPEVKWDAYLLKDEEEWTDDDWVQLDLAIARGEKIWRRSRCTICHIVEGRGGFVNVRVGKSLDKIAGKVKRDWLYRWLKNPQAYFPQTLMPRFRLSDDEIKDLVVYIMYADPFQPFEEEGENIIVISPSSNTEQIALGKRTIELSRCVLCHEIKGIR